MAATSALATALVVKTAVPSVATRPSLFHPTWLRGRPVNAAPARAFTVRRLRSFSSTQATLAKDAKVQEAKVWELSHEGTEQGRIGLYEPLPGSAEVSVAGFINKNYTSYTGDSSFLAGPTERTKKVWEECAELLKQEVAKGVLDCDPHTPAGILSHGPGYVNKELDIIVGLQTDAPLKRMIKPKGGWRMVEAALKSYGFEPDAKVEEVFTKYAKTHNQGVFDAYTDEMRACRKSHILTGLPDAYGRGRIIADYRRVALYGIDKILESKKKDLKALGPAMTEVIHTTLLLSC